MLSLSLSLCLSLSLSGILQLSQIALGAEGYGERDPLGLTIVKLFAFLPRGPRQQVFNMWETAKSGLGRSDSGYGCLMLLANIVSSFRAGSATVGFEQRHRESAAKSVAEWETSIHTQIPSGSSRASSEGTTAPSKLTQSHLLRRYLHPYK